jgi:hypothetical protein
MTPSYKHRFSPPRRSCTRASTGTARPEGAGNAGCSAHPQPRAQCESSTRVSRHRSTGSPGIPARNGFNGFLRALPGDRALLSPSSVRCGSDITFVMRGHRHQLNASVGASGPHDFAVRKYAARPRMDSASAICVHRIPHPTFVTIAIRPSQGVRDGAGC